MKVANVVHSQKTETEVCPCIILSNVRIELSISLWQDFNVRHSNGSD